MSTKSSKSEKIVSGVTRNVCARDVHAVAMRNALTPEYADNWIGWFDKSPCDRLGKSCDECKSCADEEKCNAASTKAESLPAKGVTRITVEMGFSSVTVEKTEINFDARVTARKGEFPTGALIAIAQRTLAMAEMTPEQQRECTPLFTLTPADKENLITLTENVGGLIKHGKTSEALCELLKLFKQIEKIK